MQLTTRLIKATILLAITLSILLLIFTHSIFSPQGDDTLSGCEVQKVSHVIDGDTFIIEDGRKIRLIGVDTPETVDPRKDVEFFGREAQGILKTWIEKKKVCLKKDIDKTQDIDKYGRLLRYVWVYPDAKENVFFVNAELIKQGYAFAYTRYPFQYLEEFRSLERYAREHNLGLWNNEKQKEWESRVEKNKLASLRCNGRDTICPEDAIRHVGRYKTIRFFVKKVYDSGGAIFINSENNFNDPANFTAVIFNDYRHKFPLFYSYEGKTVDVTGTIRIYHERAEIILKSPSQIRIVKLSD